MCEGHCIRYALIFIRIIFLQALDILNSKPTIFSIFHRPPTDPYLQISLDFHLEMLFVSVNQAFADFRKKITKSEPRDSRHAILVLIN